MKEFLTRSEQQKLLIEYEKDYGSTLMEYNHKLFDNNICAKKIQEISKEIHSIIDLAHFDDDILESLMELAELILNQKIYHHDQTMEETA